MNKVPINTPNGLGIIEEIYKTELNNIMIKVFFPEQNRWINYNLGKVNLNLEKVNLGNFNSIQLIIK